MNTTSESLISRLSLIEDGQPDQTAWESFVRLYTPLIFRWARQTGLGQADAADIVQDVVTRVFESLPNFHYDSAKSFRGWLKAITLNRYREIKRRRSSSMQLASESMLDRLARIEVAESTWDLSYAKALVAQAMVQRRGDFAYETWQALRLVMLEGKTVDEAANKSGVSTWTIYSARARLMKRLRDELDGLL